MLIALKYVFSLLYRRNNSPFFCAICKVQTDQQFQKNQPIFNTRVILFFFFFFFFFFVVVVVVVVLIFLNRSKREKGCNYFVKQDFSSDKVVYILVKNILQCLYILVMVQLTTKRRQAFLLTKTNKKSRSDDVRSTTKFPLFG